MATKTKTAEIDTAQQERFFDRNEYKKIYNISDMFEREQALERFAAEGKKAGVIGVKKIYAQFVKENRGGKLYASNVTAFDGQPIELVCGEWTADDTGVTKEVFGQLVDSQRAQHVDVGEQRVVHIAIVHPSIGEQQRVGPVLKAEHVTVGRCLMRIEHGEELALHTPKHLTAGHIDLHAVGQRVHLRQLPIAIEVTIV